MLKYILKRILLLIPVLIGATFIVFFVMDMTPGDPAVAKLGVDATAEQIEELREEMGLNDPFPVRYGRFVLDLVQGDLGTSYKTGLDVMQQIMQRIPYTFLLSFAALLFAVIVGIPAGIISARHQYTVFDNCTMVLTLIGASAPHFWLGLMGVIIFAVNLGWLPAAYTASDSLALGIILPMLTLGMNSTALVTRMTRSAIIPNALSPVIVQGTLGVATTILNVAGMSFLGLGIQPPAPEWGSILSSARMYMREAWHISLFPGLAIVICILSLNLLGDGLRDALDPKQKR